MRTPLSSRQSSRARTRLGFVAAAGVIVVVTASCSAAGRESKSASGPAIAAPAPPGARTGAGSGPGISANGSVSTNTGTVELADAKRPVGARRIISTAQLEVESHDINRTVQQATTLSLAAQGYVFSETASLTNQQSAHVVFKVAPDRFDSLVAAIGRLATLEHSQIGTQDVTGQVVDLSARLAAAQTSAARLQQLLANSGSLADLLTVEQQLTTREGDVDSLSGELAAVQAQVDMATITLDVSPLPAHRAAPPEPHRAGPGFTGGLHAGTTAFAATARIIEALLGLTLPFAPLLLLVLAGWWVVRRRAGAGAPVS